MSADPFVSSVSNVAPRDNRRNPIAPRGLWLALGIGLCVRVAAMSLAVEHYGDAPVRIEAAERWAQHPHLWRGFNETFQYGPLHLTMLGAALKALPNRFLAPKLVSLAFGLLSIWLIWLIAARLRGVEAAALAAVALALSPLHIQASTTGASEAPFLGLLLACLALKDSNVLASALLLGVAGLVRYDGWLYVPLIALTLGSVRRFVAFCAVNAVFVVAWLAVNKLYVGEFLAPIHWIDHDHKLLADMALAWFGRVGYRLYCLPYWPESVLIVLTPVVGLLAVAGAWRACFRKEHLALLAWIPAVYFTFRGAVLANFRPMVRFVMVASVLSLPYAWDAVTWLGARFRKPVLALAAVSLIVTPLALFRMSYGRNGGPAEWARPVSPVSSVPPGVEQAARWLRANAKPDDVVLLDGVWDYLDIPLAFEAGLPDEQWIRMSWPDLEQRLRRHTPTLAVVLYQGTLEKTIGNDDRIAFRDVRFCVAQRFVYAAIYRRCR